MCGRYCPVVVAESKREYVELAAREAGHPEKCLHCGRRKDLHCGCRLSFRERMLSVQANTARLKRARESDGRIH